jgi:hypothetical protein
MGDSLSCIPCPKGTWCAPMRGEATAAPDEHVAFATLTLAAWM